MPDLPQDSTRDSSPQLEGWESIAFHLGVHKRTARAWHKDRGLPVHQLFGKGGRVYAIASELDAWRTQSALHLPQLPVQNPASQPTQPTPAVHPSRRNTRTFLAAAFILAAASLLAVTLHSREHLSQLRQLPPTGRLLSKLTAEGAHPEAIRVGSGPCNAVVTPNGARLFVANCWGDTVSMIDTGSKRVLREISAGAQPETLALDASGRQLYVGNFWGGIGIFDTTTGNRLGRIAIDGPISDIAVAPDDTIYAARRERGLDEINPSDRRVTSIPVMAMPMYLALEPDGSRLYVSYQGRLPGGRPAHDALDIYDVKRKAFTARISGPPRVGGRMALSANGILLADGADACFAEPYKNYRAECPSPPGSVLSLIRTADARVISTLGYPGQAAGAVGVFPDGVRALTANQTLRVIDTSSLSVREAWALPNVRKVLFAPDGNKAWALQQEQGTVAVLDTGKDACATPPAGLTGWWPGDGSADDIRGSNNNGVLTGGAHFASGLVGQAFQFDGAGSLQLGAMENLSTETPDFTLMAWVKFTGEGAVEQTITARSQPNKGGLHLSRGPDGILRFQIANGSEAKTVAAPTPIPAGTWTHIAAVRAYDSIALYVNGSLAATEHLEGTAWKGPSAGEMQWGQSLRGLLDELQWFNRALDSASIKAVASARQSGICE